MSETKLSPRSKATYQGIMTTRRGQEVVIGNTVGGLVSCTFPDGAVIGCAATALRPA